MAAISDETEIRFASDERKTFDVIRYSCEKKVALEASDQMELTVGNERSERIPRLTIN